MTRFALIPSPFVGGGAWRAVAELLPDAVAVDYGGVSGPDWYDGLARRIGARFDDRPWIAVLHSGAGGYAPALAAAATHLAGFIFVDAILPYPGLSNLETAPADFQAQLRALTVDGCLAPWNQWFGEDVLPRLVPDAAAREAFVRELPRVPFAYLEAISPDEHGWEALPCVYLQLSRGYDATAAKARARGWPVAQLRSNHLGMVRDAEAVAQAIVKLAP